MTRNVKVNVKGIFVLEMNSYENVLKSAGKLRYEGIPAFHAGDTGSNPVRDARFQGFRFFDLPLFYLFPAIFPAASSKIRVNRSWLCALG
jgi:hypothetical protein